MNPLYQPVIGSSFDALAGQQSGWANFNRGVEEANMGRLAAAQQTRNNWLAQVQQINQQQADREYQVQQQADAEARDAARATESRRQFDVGTDLTREQMQAKLDAQKLGLQREYQTTGNAGQALSPYTHEYAAAVEDSRTELEKATKALDTEAASAQASAPTGKIVYNSRAKMFVPSDQFRTDAEAQTAAGAANSKVSNAKAAYDTAAQEFKFHTGRLADLQKQAGGFGLIVSKKGDRWVLVDAATGRAFQSPEKPATKTASSSIFMPVMGARQMADDASMAAMPASAPEEPTSSSSWWNSWTKGVASQPSISTRRRRYNPDTGLIE